MKAIFENMENYLSYSENKAWKKIQPPKGFESMLVRNKLVKWWTHNDSETATFADDTKLYKETRSSDDELALQTDLSNVGSWFTESGLEYNKTKSHHQSITRKTKALLTIWMKLKQVKNVILASGFPFSPILFLYIHSHRFITSQVYFEAT